MTAERLPSAGTVWRVAVGGVLVALLVSVYGDAGAVLGQLSALDPRVFALALGLTLGNQALRFLKWEYLLRELDIDVPVQSSLFVFTKALVMIVSPGKVGETWKCWLLRDRHGTPVRQSLPVVAVERLTDLLGVTILTVVGAAAFGRSLTLVGTVLVVVGLGVASLRSRRFWDWWFDRFERLPVHAVADRVQEAREVYHGSYRLLSGKPLGVATASSVASWGLECLGLWVVVNGFGAELSVFAAAFTFGLSSVVGAASLLPGGVGATEGSMTLLLVGFGVPREASVGATLVVRVATLWFSTGLAVVAIAGQRCVRAVMSGRQ